MGAIPDGKQGGTAQIAIFNDSAYGVVASAFVSIQEKTMGVPRGWQFFMVLRSNEASVDVELQKDNCKYAATETTCLEGR